MRRTYEEHPVPRSPRRDPVGLEWCTGTRGPAWSGRAVRCVIGWAVWVSPRLDHGAALHLLSPGRLVTFQKAFAGSRTPRLAWRRSFTRTELLLVTLRFLRVIAGGARELLPSRRRGTVS